MLVLPFLPGVVLSGGTATGPVSSTVGSIPSALTIPAPPAWLPIAALGAWIALMSVSLTRLLLNLRAVQRLARDARPLPMERIGRFVQFMDAQAGSRPARVCVSDAIRGACAVGFFKPSIMLSWDLVAALDDAALEAIVLHEYAHLQRYDDWTRLLQQFVLSVAGLHPGVRWASRQIDIEREAACDRLVVARTGAPVYYARSLTAAAEISSRMSGLTAIAAPGAPMNGRGLHARVARLLAAVPARPSVAWGSAAAGSVAVVVATAASTGLASDDHRLLARASHPGACQRAAATWTESAVADGRVREPFRVRPWRRHVTGRRQPSPAVREQRGACVDTGRSREHRTATGRRDPSRRVRNDGSSAGGSATGGCLGARTAGPACIRAPGAGDAFASREASQHQPRLDA